MALCLHGFPDQPSSFVPIMKHLAAAGLRAVAPWMRGYSPSVLEGPYDVGTLAEDVIELSCVLSPRQPTILIGHDWGAAATYAAIGLAPGRFLAAVTLALPHPLAFTSSLLRQPGQLRRSWYMLFFQFSALSETIVARRDFAFIDWLWRSWSPGYRLPDQARDELHRCMAASMPAPVAYYRALIRPLRHAVAQMRDGARRRIGTPTLHLHGADDGCVAASAGRGQGRFFDGPFASHVIPDAGHFLPLEAPAEVAEKTVAWVNRWVADLG